MVYYKCEKCEYTTKDKSRFNKHLKKKTPCYPKDTICISSLQNPPTTLQNPPICLQNPPICLQTPSTLENTDNDLDCMYCGIKFKRKDNLSRHINYRCKIIKSQIDELEVEKSKWADEKLELESKTIELEKKVEQLSNDLINHNK